MLFLSRDPLQKWLLYFRKKLNLVKRHYLPYYWSDKGFKSTVVNLALSSLHGGSLETTLSITLGSFAPQRTPWPFSKSKFNLKSDRVNLVAPANSIELAGAIWFIYLMSRQYSTKWDRKGWPDSEIQMFYGCPPVHVFYSCSWE